MRQRVGGQKAAEARRTVPSTTWRNSARRTSRDSLTTMHSTDSDVVRGKRRKERGLLRTAPELVTTGTIRPWVASTPPEAEL